MNRDQDPQFELDRIGGAVRECLDGSTAQLPSRITDRLYLARLAAMAAPRCLPFGCRNGAPAACWRVRSVASPDHRLPKT